MLQHLGLKLMQGAGEEWTELYKKVLRGNAGARNVAVIKKLPVLAALQTGRAVAGGCNE